MRTIRNIGIAVCLLLAVVAFRWGWSSVSAVMVERKVAYWSTHPEQVNAAMSEKNWLRAQSAVDLQPNNAHHWYLLGKAAEWNAYTAEDQAARQTWLDQADKALLHSAKLRPTWPNTWLALSELKLNQGQVDDEFNRYFADAFRYGRYKRDVAWGLLSIGLKSWDSYSPASKQITLALIQDQLQMYGHRQKLMAMAEGVSNKRLVCTVWRVRFNGEKWQPCDS